MVSPKISAFMSKVHDRYIYYLLYLADPFPQCQYCLAHLCLYDPFACLERL